MKVWELLTKLEGANPEATVVARDQELTLEVDEAVVEPPAESTARVVLILTG